MLIIRETFQKLNKYSELYKIQFIRDEETIISCVASDLLSDSPEDATLSRDLSFIFDIKNVFKLGVECGSNKETIQTQSIYLDKDDNIISAEEYTTNN